jgi:hypothetical protein
MVFPFRRVASWLTPGRGQLPKALFGASRSAKVRRKPDMEIEMGKCRLLQWKILSTVAPVRRDQPCRTNEEFRGISANERNN